MAGSFSPSVASAITDYDIQGTELVEIDAASYSATDKEYFSLFTNQRKVTQPVTPSLGYGPATGYGLVEKGNTPDEIQRMLDRKKTFFPRGMGARVTLAEEDMQDAEAYGGSAKKLINGSKDTLPKCRKIALNQMAAALLVCGVEGNSLPAGMPWLDVYCADLLTYFNTAHTYKESGQTYANMPTTSDGDLSPGIAALEAMYAIGNAIRTNNGLPTQIQYDTLVFPRLQEPTWNQIYDSQFDPYTSINAVNKARGLVGKSGSTELYANPWLPNGIFFAMARSMEPDMRPVQHIIYKEPKITPWEWVPSRTLVWFMFSRENMQAAMYGFGAVTSWSPIPA